MATELGHHTGRSYEDQSGNLHLNGASLFVFTGSRLGSDDSTPLTLSTRFAVTAVDSLVAHAGGGQALGTLLSADYNRVTTVASIGDSCLLPASFPGMEITVTNAAANSMNVFPATGEAINALGANTAFAVAGGKTATFFCATAGQIHTILSA